MGVMGTFTYLKNFLKDKDVASVTPTSKTCIKKVCRHIDFSRDITVVEYGAGTGVFSTYMLDQMTPGSRLILFETNSDFFEELQEIDDRRVELYQQSVEHVIDLLDESLHEGVDYIVSGIPFSFLDNDETVSVLKQSRQLLKKGGFFLAYQTSGHLKDPLKEVFDRLETEFVLFNIPPMLVYKAAKEA